MDLQRHYDEYKFNDYFRTVMPTHWLEKRLGYLAKEESAAFVDGPFGSDLKSNDYKQSGIPLIQLNNIRDSKHLMQNMKFVTEEKKQQLIRHLAIPGDVVIAKMADPVARSAIVSNKYPEYVIVADCVKLTPNLGLVDLSYLVWAINCDFVRINAELVSTGTTRVRVNLGELKKLKIPYPPLDEQRFIANFLDHETAKIDTLIDKQQQLITLLKEKRQAVISHAVTKGLNPEAPMRDSGVEWLGEVPEHWIVRRLKHISPKVGVGLVINPSTYTKDEGVYFIFGGDVKEYRFDLTKTRRITPQDSDNLLPSRLNHRDLVSVRVGYPGITAVVTEELEGANCASVIVIRRGKYNSDWLCAAMNVWVGRQQVDLVSYGAAQKQFNVADAIEFIFPVPPKDEQDKIAIYIEESLYKFNTLTEKAELQINLLKERRTALISAAVTGKIDVRNWKAA
jgi:type I restriction enzyme S subunit